MIFGMPMSKSVMFIDFAFIGLVMFIFFVEGRKCDDAFHDCNVGMYGNKIGKWL